MMSCGFFVSDAMKKLKVMTVVGTRPEIIRLSRVLPLLDAALQHVLVHTGQNYDYELNQVFDDLVCASQTILNAAVGSAAETIGTIIAKMDGLLLAKSPGHAGAGRHQQLPERDPGQTAQGFNLSYRLATAGTTCGCPKKSTAASLDTQQTSTSPTAPLPATTSCARAYRPRPGHQDRQPHV